MKALLVAVALLPSIAVAATQPMTRQQVVDLATSGLGYSYWWGHGRWRTDGASHGSCSGNCPSCTHSGSYGADCSGFVAKCWQVPSPSAVDTDAHPYSTYNFFYDTTHWSHISTSSLLQADGAVYRNAADTGGHVVLFDKYVSGGGSYIWEAKGCSYGIVHDQKTFTSVWRGLRREQISSEPPVVVDPSLEEVKVMSAAWDEGAATSDFDGDGKADFCARASAGFRCYPSSGAGFGGAVALAAMASADGWDADAYNTTIRMADFDGDGKADVCARASDGIHCWNSAGDHWGAEYRGPALSDASGWSDPMYYTTLRVADVNGDGKADLCARSSADFSCWLSDGAGFPTKVVGPALSNASGWDHLEYYSTLRMGDVNGDGKADVCGRGAAGVSCWLSDGAGFPTQIAGPALSDANGWNKPGYHLTIRLADVNGDGKADLCARAAAGFQCWVADANGFSATGYGAGAMSDASGWNVPMYYSSIRMGDVNGDGKLDVCARASGGAFCWLWGANGHEERLTGPAWSNSSGWDDPEHWRTMRLADFDGDGKADLCARANAGLVCASSTGTGFGASYNGPAFSDASSWNQLKYYATFRAATPAKKPTTPCVSSPEVCNGADDDCDDLVDEDLDCSQDAGAPIAPRDAAAPVEMLDDAGIPEEAPDASGEGEDLGEQEVVNGGCTCASGPRGSAAWLALLGLAGALAPRRRR